MSSTVTRILPLALLSLACSPAPSPGGDDVGETGTDEQGELDSSGDASSETGDQGDQGDQGDRGDTGAPACSELPGPWDSGHAMTKQAPLPGDPQLGLNVLLEEDYVSCGIPMSLFTIAQPFVGDFAQGQSLPWRPGKNAQVPYSWNVVTMGDGSELAVPNCFNCHGGEFDGQLVLGLGRQDIDFTEDLGALLGLVPSLPALNDAGAAFNKFVERYSVMSPPSQMLTIGTNPAIMYALVLVSRRNPFTLAWLDEPIQELPPGLILPADPPPWWRARKKAGQFSNGMSRGDHRGTMVLASSLCTDSAAEAAGILDDFIHVNAYLESLEAPKYEQFSGPPIDQAKAAQGKELFECSCAGCHGSYDPDPQAETYPNLLIPLEVVGTDPTMAAYAAGPLNYLEEWFEASYYGTVTDLATNDPFPGYVAPPLDGIWATAPYFHNGSVPTLELVLDSSKRAPYWKRLDFDSEHYDWLALGWPWTAVATGQDQAPAGERKLIYDTSKLGHDNGGHTFGDHFSAGERAAVLEYLKTL